MRRFYRTVLTMCIALLCIFFVPSRTQAADYTPGQVTNLKATAGESIVTLKWKAASKAGGYYIYCLDSATNQFKRIANTKNTTYTVKKLKNKTKYTFKVCAYRTRGSKTYTGALSSAVTATPMVEKPARVKLYVSSCANKSVTLKWEKITGATGYQIYQKNMSTKKYVLIGTVKGTSVTVSKLKNGVEYRFRVCAFRKVNGVTRYGRRSRMVSAKPLSVASEVKSVRTMYYKATLKNTVNAPVVEKGKVTSSKVQIKAGTSVTVTSRTSTDCIVKLSSGKYASVDKSDLNFLSCLYNSKMDYSSAAKEAFVNSKGFTSPTGYLIWINLYHQKVYLYRGSRGKWKLFQTYRCSSGRASAPTPAGQYYLYQKTPKFIFDEYSYADYACYFSGSALHSWLKYSANGQLVPDGSLGIPVSHGCVRLQSDDIYFIYKNIPMYTRIVIY